MIELFFFNSYLILFTFFVNEKLPRGYWEVREVSARFLFFPLLDTAAAEKGMRERSEGREEQ